MTLILKETRRFESIDEAVRWLTNRGYSERQEPDMGSIWRGPQHRHAVVFRHADYIGAVDSPVTVIIYLDYE